MSATSKLAQLALFVVVSLLPLTSAQADPIALSGGASVGPFLDLRGFVNVTGTNSDTNLAADVSTTDINSGWSRCTTMNPGGCTGANMSWFSQGSSFRGHVIVNGVSYGTDINNTLSLQFNGASFSIPPELQSQGSFKITGPFSLTGFFDASPSLPQRLDLTGQGTVTAFLSRRTGVFPGIYLDEASYVFGPTVDRVTVEAVPEPATLLLLVSGLAGTVIRLRKRAGR